MNKFKVGDMVKVIDCFHRPGSLYPVPATIQSIGSIFKVVDISIYDNIHLSNQYIYDPRSLRLVHIEEVSEDEL